MGIFPVNSSQCIYMNEKAKPYSFVNDARTGRRRMLALRNENRVLRSAIADLKLRSLQEKNAIADERDTLLLLREANQHLVLTTFSAEDAKVAAEAANRRQTVFLSMLSHELRNPIASIAVANTVLGSLNIGHARMDKLVAIIGRQTKYLVRLVDDLLDASRISTGKISLQTSLILFSDAVEGALDTARPYLTQRSQSLVLALPPRPVLIIGDTVRLAQLFANLLINASKFSPPGQTIQLSAEVRGGTFAVTVKDQGKGIAAQFQPRIFDLFAQGPDDDEHTLSGGLGIGLALVKSIAEMHGGSVRVASEGAGCGSEFTVLLPLPVTNEAAPV